MQKRVKSILVISTVIASISAVPALSCERPGAARIAYDWVTKHDADAKTRFFEDIRRGVEPIQALLNRFGTRDVNSYNAIKACQNTVRAWMDSEGI